MSGICSVSDRYPEVVVRQLTQGDLPAILDIEHQGYSHPWSEGVFRDTFRSGYSLLGIEQAGRLEAYAVQATLFDEAHLLNLCVRLQAAAGGMRASCCAFCWLTLPVRGYSAWCWRSVSAIRAPGDSTRARALSLSGSGRVITRTVPGGRMRSSWPWGSPGRRIRPAESFVSCCLISENAQLFTTDPGGASPA